MPLLHDNDDLRILPSTDSHSDLAFDNNSSSPSYIPSSVQDKPSESYTRGEASHRTQLLQPSDTEPQPLHHCESTSVDDALACHCEPFSH